MAHNLATNADGTKSFYSLREGAWHGLGTVVDLPLTDPEIAKAAGLAWAPEVVGLYRQDMEVVAEHKAIVRSDTRETLGIVGKGYVPLANDTLFGFFRAVAGSSGMTVETAGALGRGERVWALARVPSLDLVLGQDASRGYLLISTSHDGSASVRIQPTLVRVVCQNTLRMAMGGRARRGTLTTGYSVRHTAGMDAAIRDIAQAYAQARTDWDATKDMVTTLASRTLTHAAFDAMMAAAFKSGEGDRARALAENRAVKIRTILAGPTCNVQGTAGTLWAGLNAITEYIDHDAQTRVVAEGSERENRFESAVLGGNGDRAKANALDAALALV